MRIKERMIEREKVKDRKRRRAKKLFVMLLQTRLFVRYYDLFYYKRFYTAHIVMIDLSCDDERMSAKNNNNN